MKISEYTDANDKNKKGVVCLCTLNYNPAQRLQGNVKANLPALLLICSQLKRSHYGNNPEFPLLTL